MAARTCESRTAGLDRCCGTLSPGTEVSTAGQLTQSPLSELGALASLPHVLLSNKLAGSTSGHLYLRVQVQNFLSVIQ